MQRRQCLQLSLGLLTAGLASPSIAATGLRASDWKQRLLIGFGTTVWLRAAHANEALTERALDAAVQLLRDIEAQLSLFLPHSAVTQLNQRGFFDGDAAHLRRVLAFSRHISARSNGDFDVTMQPLWTAWASAVQRGTSPSPQALSNACSRVNWRDVIIDDLGVRLAQPHMAISLNGIAQGYAADQVRDLFRSYGIEHAHIDTGETTSIQPKGELSAEAFRIEDLINPEPSAAPTVLPAGRAAATSSDAHTSFTSDRLHHHIVNPRTGCSPLHWASVTVLAPTAITADALTKVFFMLPPSRVAVVAQAWAVEVHLQNKQGQWVHADGRPQTQRTIAPHVNG